tara:strand:- start:794 stop:1471 length:678 start_codon:yes stop_codon:yes gene_type:complete
MGESDEATKVRTMSTAQRIRKILAINSIDDWTRGFCESLLQQTRKGRRLSERQFQILASKETAYSTERLQEENVWTEQWNKEKAEIFILCSLYYHKSGYFVNTAMNVSPEGKIKEGYVPSKRAFNKMCNNKYAMKIRGAWSSAPLYAVGSVVSLRANAPHSSGGVVLYKHNAGKTIPYFVLETNNEYPSSASKGAKRYKLLAAGSAMPVTVEERHIKKMRRQKKK